MGNTHTNGGAHGRKRPAESDPRESLHGQGSLKAFAARRPVPCAERLELARALYEELAGLHEDGLVTTQPLLDAALVVPGAGVVLTDRGAPPTSSEDAKRDLVAYARAVLVLLATDPSGVGCGVAHAPAGWATRVLRQEWRVPSDPRCTGDAPRSSVPLACPGDAAVRALAAWAADVAESGSARTPPPLGDAAGPRP